jgi:hypothetical protein
MPRKDLEVVLVHGAWADASSWARVISALSAGGFGRQARNGHASGLALTWTAGVGRRRFSLPRLCIHAE